LVAAKRRRRRKNDAKYFWQKDGGEKIRFFTAGNRGAERGRKIWGRNMEIFTEGNKANEGRQKGNRIEAEAQIFNHGRRRGKTKTKSQVRAPFISTGA
jgi:hypothetical protein